LAVDPVNFRQLRWHSSRHCSVSNKYLAYSLQTVCPSGDARAALAIGITIGTLF